MAVLGDNAVNQSAPEWGPYEYSKILDSLSRRGFFVVSERGIESVDDSVYISRICLQIDTLLRRKVKPSNILVLGASAGSHIALHVSARIKNSDIKCIIMGGCWSNAYKDYQGLELYGQFLSIIESSDPHGTCRAIF